MNWSTTGPGPANDHWKRPGDVGFDESVTPDSIDLKKLKYGWARIWTSVNAES
jgi:hypothetical protein